MTLFVTVLQENAMKKAIAIAPRGKRAMELLNISVGVVLSSSKLINSFLDVQGL